MIKILVIKYAQVCVDNPISNMAIFEYWKRKGTATFYKTVISDGGSRSVSKKINSPDEGDYGYHIAKSDYGDLAKSITLVGKIDRSDPLLLDVAKKLKDRFFNEPKGRLTPKPKFQIIEIPEGVKWHIEGVNNGGATCGTYNEHVVENYREWFF